jgi:organic radical activating enzyme
MNKIQLPESLASEKILLCKEDAHFISPQGEGKYMGRLSAWMRVSSCNLKCAWLNADGSVTLCDTPYTSHKISRDLPRSFRLSIK